MKKCNKCGGEMRAISVSDLYYKSEGMQCMICGKMYWLDSGTFKGYREGLSDYEMKILRRDDLNKAQPHANRKRKDGG